MIKTILSALSMFVFISLSMIPVFAAPFALTKIGALDLGGQTYPEWWYTGIYPVLYGTGEAGKEVNITVGQMVSRIHADSSGNWIYPSQAGQGDYDVSIVQDSNSYSFKLHLGQALPENIGGTAAQTTESTSSVPSTGYNQIASMGFGLGVALLASYFYISGDTNRKHLFEKRILKEDR